MKLTKAEWARINHAAFNEFMKIIEGRENEVFAGGRSIATIYSIASPGRTEHWVLQHKEQLNENTLTEAGFDPAVAATGYVATINRNTKTLKY